MPFTTTRKNPLEDEKVKKLAEEQVALEAAKPANWTGGTYGESLKTALDRINNREKFTYDLNADMLYNQYKDQYINAGKMAMADTMGQAAALTGGYGNSYAATVGNQAYQSYLQQLNNKVPELYQLALNRYNQEGQDLKDQYSLYSDMYNREYGENQDAYNRWNANRNRADSLYQAALDYATNEANTEYGNAYNAEMYAYQQARDKAADEQWAKQFAETQRQNQIANEQWEKNFALQQANAARSGGGSSSNKTINEDVVDYAKMDGYAAKFSKLTAKQAKAEVNSLLNSGKITFREADYLLDKYGKEFNPAEPAVKVATGATQAIKNMAAKLKGLTK